MGGCQNYDPFWGTLKIRCRSIIGIQKGAIMLTTTHIGDYIMLTTTHIGDYIGEYFSYRGITCVFDSPVVRRAVAQFLWVTGRTSLLLSLAIMVIIMAATCSINISTGFTSP